MMGMAQGHLVAKSSSTHPGCHSESLLRGICFSLFRYAPNSRSLVKASRDDIFKHNLQHQQFFALLIKHFDTDDGYRAHLPNPAALPIYKIQKFKHSIYGKTVHCIWCDNS
jgi:hypothetical protein